MYTILEGTIPYHTRYFLKPNILYQSICYHHSFLFLPHLHIPFSLHCYLKFKTNARYYYSMFVAMAIGLRFQFTSYINCSKCMIFFFCLANFEIVWHQFHFDLGVIFPTEIHGTLGILVLGVQPKLSLHSCSGSQSKFIL